VPAVAFGRLAVVICSGGCGAGVGGGDGAPPPAPPPPITVNTNCLSEWLSPPHQEGPPSVAVRSWTVTHGCAVAAAVAVPVTRPLEDIDKPGGIPPFVISHR
jgi:hypothetical protein